MEVVKALGDDVLDGGTLVERGCGILEYHLNLPYNLAVILLGELARYPLALEVYGTCRAGVDTDNGTTDGGLTGAGLADEGKGLTLVDVKADIINRFEALFAPAEDNIKILY